MPRPRPLGSPAAARATLAHRFTGRADRLRQLNTRFGLRARRVFLVWTQCTGVNRGTGQEIEFARREILPTPRVADATAISRRPISIAIVPDGSLRVDQISCGVYTEDNLRGKSIPKDVDMDPGTAPHSVVLLGANPADPNLPQSIDFFYEIVEDGRGDEPPTRSRFMLLSTPWRNEGNLQWGIYLQPQSGGLDRDGNSQLIGDDVLDVE